VIELELISALLWRPVSTSIFHRNFVMLFWYVATVATSQHDLLNAHCARYSKVPCWTIGVEFEETKQKYVDLKDCCLFTVTETGKC
jgi:hypothetical protein